MNAQTTAPATVRQITFLNGLLDDAVKLLDRRDDITGCEWPEARAHVQRIRDAVFNMGKVEASAAITAAIDNNKSLRNELEGLGAEVRPARKTADEYVTEVGMYRVGDQVFKVLPSRSSNRMYAKELVGFHMVDGRPVSDDGTANLKFVYAKGAMCLIGSEHRMSPEQEREFGRLVGACVDCGKLLTDPKSIEYGKGPKCSGNYKH